MYYTFLENIQNRVRIAWLRGTKGLAAIVLEVFAARTLLEHSCNNVRRVHKNSNREPATSRLTEK